MRVRRNRNLVNKEKIISFDINMEAKCKEKVQMSKASYVLLFIIAFLSAYSAILCLISGFQLEVINNSIEVTIAATVLVNIGLKLLKHRKCFNIALFVFYVISVLYMIKPFVKGLIYILNKFILEYNNYYDTVFLTFDLKTGPIIYNTSVFLVFISVLLTFGVFHTVVYSHKRVRYILITAPFAVLPLIVGFVSKPLYFIVYIVCIFCNTGVTNQTKREQSATSGRNSEIISLKVQSIIGLVTMAIFLISYFAFPPNVYEKKVNVYEIKKSVQKTMFDIGEKYFTYENSIFYIKNDIASGGVSGGKLGSVDRIKYKNETDLLVTLPKSIKNRVYLKAFVGSNYSGDRWESTDFSTIDLNKYYDVQSDSSYLSILPSYVLSLSSKVHYQDMTPYTYSKISIENVGANKSYDYVPYQCATINTPGIEGIEKSGNGGGGTKNYNFYAHNHEMDYSKNFGLIQRTLNYVSNNARGTLIVEPNSGYDYKVDAILLLSEYVDKEQAYENFVYDLYTRVPEGLEDIDALRMGMVYTHETLESNHLLNTYNGDEIKIKNNLNEVIERVRRILNNNTKYTLSPGKLPEGKDFITYFLLENKKGYCTHYASSATMLFRMMNVPARYVEGYVINSNQIEKSKVVKSDTVTYYDGVLKEKTENFVEVAVKDSSAHAWVEIYLDGYGWIPVEVTPSYYNASILANSNNAENKNNIVNKTNSNSNKQQMNEYKKIEKDKKAKNKKEDLKAKRTSRDTRKKISTKKDTKIDQVFHKIDTISIALGMIIRVLIFTSLILLFLMSGLLIRKEYCNIKRRKLLKKLDINRKVKVYQKEIGEILKCYELEKGEEENYISFSNRVSREVMGVNKDIVIESLFIGYKAHFSNSKLDKSELRKVFCLKKYLRQELYKNSSKVRRFYLLYIKLV